MSLKSKHVDTARDCQYGEGAARAQAWTGPSGPSQGLVPFNPCSDSVAFHGPPTCCRQNRNKTKQKQKKKKQKQEFSLTPSPPQPFRSICHDSKISTSLEPITLPIPEFRSSPAWEPQLLKFTSVTALGAETTGMVLSSASLKINK